MPAIVDGSINEGDNGEEPPQQGTGYVSTAYETISTWSWQAKLGVLAAFILCLMMLQNIFLTDYNSQTTTYLKSIGREDMVTQVIPPTVSDIRKAQYVREALIIGLAANMTIVMGELKNLRGEVDALKKKSASPSGANAVSASAGGGIM